MFCYIAQFYHAIHGLGLLLDLLQQKNNNMRSLNLSSFIPFKLKTLHYSND